MITKTRRAAHVSRLTPRSRTPVKTRSRRGGRSSNPPFPTVVMSQDMCARQKGSPPCAAPSRSARGPILDRSRIGPCRARVSFAGEAHRDFFVAAGLRLERIIPTSSPNSILEGSPSWHPFLHRQLKRAHFYAGRPNVPWSTCPTTRAERKRRSSLRRRRTVRFRLRRRKLPCRSRC